MITNPQKIRKFENFTAVFPDFLPQVPVFCLTIFLGATSTICLKGRYFKLQVKNFLLISFCFHSVQSMAADTIITQRKFGSGFVSL